VVSLIEDYALLTDTQTSALVSKEGSIDWLRLPRFDSAGPFAALLRDVENGRWLIAPHLPVRGSRRRYRGDSVVLETDVETADGSIRLVEFVPIRAEVPAVVRLVEGVRGRVRMHMDFRPRFDDGRIRPRFGRVDGADVAIAEPECVRLCSPVETRADDAAIRADFVVSAGELLPFVLSWHHSHEPASAPIDPLRALAATE
jgi:GH15 family glucan-1,4-alpha-glucosidase